MKASRGDLAGSLVGVLIGALVVWGGATAATQPNWELGRTFGVLISVTGAAAIAASLLALGRPVFGGIVTIIAAISISIAVALAMPWAWFVVLPLTVPLGLIGLRRLRQARTPSIP